VGNSKKRKLIFLGVLLVIGAVVVHWQRGGSAGIKQETLADYLMNVPGYTSTGHVPLDEGVVKFLDLDDYLQSTYRQAGISDPMEAVSLYIGYYNSLAKISAAHSPLVCFPGQGWTIDMPSENEIDIAGRRIKYSEIIAKLHDTRLLVIFWYQAGDQTEAEVYKNKLNAVKNRFTGKSEEHAFVRITAPLVGDSIDEARTRAFAFLKAFYPLFLDYVNSPQISKSI